MRPVLLPRYRSLPALMTAFWLAGLTGCTTAPGTPETVDLILRDVRVVDTQAGASTEPVDVAVNEGLIIRIGDLADWQASREVDLTGHYLLAGLWDLHVHLESTTPEGVEKLEPLDWDIPLSMSYGVLGLRDLGSRTDDILELRQTLNSQRDRLEAAPLLKVAGQSFSGQQPWGYVDHTLLPATPAEAEAMVNAQVSKGVDFIKTHDFIAPDIYAAITRAAGAQDFQVVGHLRPYSGPLESIASGQRDFDHLPPELLSYCGSDGEKDAENFYAGWYTGGPGYYERAMAELYQPEGCAVLFQKMAQAGASVTPTLSVRSPVSDRMFQAAEQFLPADRLVSCRQTRTFSVSSPGEDRRSYSRMTSEVVQQLSASGVLIGTGTDDSPETCAIPGLILHDELKELRDSGLTVPQVLDAATRISAMIAGSEKSGRVAEGYFADLVLTKTDPLESLAALDEITGVVAAGAFLGAEDLDALRARAKPSTGQ